MKKIKLIGNCRLMIPALVFLCILSTPLWTYAGVLYHCVDKTGNETLSDYPLEGKTCKPVGESHEMTAEEADQYYRERENISKEEYEKDKAAEEARKAKNKLDECLESAIRLDTLKRNGYCKSLDRDPYCLLPPVLTKQLDDHLQKEKNKCSQLYPQENSNQ